MTDFWRGFVTALLAGVGFWLSIVVLILLYF